MRVSAVIPAYNEAENIALVVNGLRALTGPTGLPLIFEVIVADNNSLDATATTALAAGASVIFVKQKGYGNACFQACKIATGDVLLFVDGDHTADLTQVRDVLQAIDEGATLSIGARKYADRGSLTTAQKFGNAFACYLIRKIWQIPVTDLGPLRAIRRSAYDLIDMQDRSFGWTIEMQIRAAQLKISTKEIPIRWRARHAGHSKVSGTVSGVIGAGWGILSMIVKLKWREFSSTSIHSTVSSTKTSPKET
jgi:glycosyltransferase involved in cell wall biosynthesis